MNNEEIRQKTIQMRMGDIRMSRDREYWTEEDKAVLVREYKNGTGINEIAMMLKRSENAIHQKVEQLGLCVRNPFSREYQPLRKKHQRLAGTGGAVDDQGRRVCIKERGHRHHYTNREVHADDFRRGGGVGTGVHPAATGRGNRHCQRTRGVQRSTNCCNWDEGTCLLLEMPCPQQLSLTRINCRYFREAVLPANQRLYQSIMNNN